MIQMKTIRDAMRLVAATSAVLLATGAGSAFASTSVDGDNNTTGPYSSNNTSVNVHHNTNLDIKNDSNLKNKVKADINTGHNYVKYNTLVEDGANETGDASADVVINNDTSNGWVGDLGLGGGISLGDTSVDADLSNHLTGPFSDNNNSVKVNTNRTVTIKNNAHIDNNVNLKEDTGHNSTVGNTAVTGGSSTGSAEASVDISNHTAGTPDLSGILGLGGGDVTVSGGNTLTGPGSENNNTVKVNQNDTVKITNDAHINNDVNANLNTGHNNTSYNTEVGGGSTGDASFSAMIDNTTN